ncbi:macrolide family glycosyltransferase [Microbispora sp. NBRC 16548]|uniref:macrolide family glycosyltransferase n=1 Tax=Microbispora sp. NBRC 16548 TaxID=3030994 RepID=UPI0024A5FDC0|nr:macrolide family glycosyltransferase [Microbispora sp. NBRC 16548]GLX11602.1 UDP glycosyltransferase [Microbispora sp. NBRC 16548]
MAFHLLVLDIPSNGHVLPKVAVVDELVRRGHRVTYVVAERLADRVRLFGAEVVAYRSPDPLASLAEDDPAAGTRAFFQENLAILRAARERFGDDRPDAVAYDEAAFQAGRILASTWGLPPVLLSPSVVSNEHYDYFDHMERLAPGHRLADPVEEIERALREFGLAGRLRDFLWTTRRVEEFTIVFVPPLLQPAYETFDPERVVFVGPAAERRDFLGAWEPPAPGRRVVLVSLGSVRNADARFFETVIGAFAGRPWHVVVSVGDGLGDAAFERLAGLAPNAEVHRWISNVGVLAHADAFVTHGGTGSLMEAWHTATPVVIVPPAPDFLPYADRVAELGAGTVISPSGLDAVRLVAEVETLASDASVRARMRELRDHTRAAGGARRAADAIEAYVKGETGE